MEHRRPHNIEIDELQVHMINRKVGIICLQETHWTDSAYFVTDAGFLLITSGRGMRHMQALVSWSPLIAAGVLLVSANFLVGKRR